ncbi:MAG: bifunctional 4-hydroxy-2-oxoglutarate aldolase/2-dehydro-3-deoxy-phosphogluconate aldolase [Verrucomicrobia bacterium]|nr:bifunctional 4-hydroxy-2-oxoglutarate aldolase/2-dehydro-3-deoxy-phosphogluconate aldolase [Verrucomicrobiota bacterium]
MRFKSEVISLLINPGIIAVVRAQKREQVVPLTEALVQGGVIAVEITMTTPQAIEAISEATQHFGSRALIGVGTVLDGKTCRTAIQAGAEFVVSPITKAEIVEAAHAVDRPVMLGAYTPTEAQTAHELGADFVKLFPADGLGPSYIKALRAPLPHLKIVPTGGVDLNTAADFIKAGCVALGAGSSLVSAKLLQEAKWPEITRLAQEFVAVVKKARGR